MRFISTLLVAAFALTGCQSIRSGSVSTEHMRADITVTSDGSSSVEVNAELRHEDSSLVFVDLDRGERLVASSSEHQAELRAGFYDYNAHLPISSSQDLISIGLERIQGIDAPYSVVELPTPFRLYPNASIFSLAYDVIPVEWDRLSDDEMQVEIEGNCITDRTLYIGRFEDNGIALIEPGDLTPRPHWDGGLCPVEITVKRSRKGQLDSGFSRGEIVAHQVRTMDILVML
jgi:uncharacterized protein YcfL